MKTNSHSRGLTLIESVVWVSVFAFIMATLVTSLLFFYSTNRYVLQEAVAIASTQRVMDSTIRTIRSASYSAVGAYPIVSIGANQITFYASAAANSSIIQQVRFFVIGTQLKVGIIQPTGSPLTYNPANEVITFVGDNIQNITVGTSTFFYYDKTGAQVTDYTHIQDVRFITMNAVVDVSTTTAPLATTLSASAALRNLIGH
jgi:type II secretory pathway pseudopilin PulG